MRTPLMKWFGARSPEAGSVTAEYGVLALVAASFALVLLGIVRSGPVKGLLLHIIQRALGVV